MLIYEKAKELAKLIEESNELKELKKLELEVEKDSTAIVLTKKYSDLYNKIAEAIKEDDIEVIEVLKEKMVEAYREVEDYELTKRLFKAKELFDNMVNTINSIINHSIVGEEECQSHSCCSSCSSCN